MHLGWGRPKSIACTIFVTSVACMSSSDFDAKLATYRGQLEVMTTQAQACVHDLRAMAAPAPAVAAREAEPPGVMASAPASDIPEQFWKNVSRRQHVLDGAGTMLSRAATIGPGALEPVVMSVARAHEAYRELCRARDDLATRRALPRIARSHAMADPSLGQFDR